MSKQNFKKTEATANMIPETARKAWQDFFSAIKERCLDRNFGTLSKSEFDLLLFHYYLQNKQEEVGSRYVSDYDIGRDLGLTIQRVRALREKEVLKWAIEVDWKKSFIQSLKLAHCDLKDDVSNSDIKIPVPDVNVMKEVRHYLEEAGLFDDYQLNPKVFQCKLDVLIAICLSFEQTDNDFCKTILNELRNSNDGNVSRAVAEREHPNLAALSKAAKKSLQDSMSMIPVVGKACGEAVVSMLDNYLGNKRVKAS